MPKLTIDNREIEVAAGTKVITAAEQLGIMIPRFCYHPALGSVGACRVCAVAFTDGPVKGIQMSCMVNAQDGMVVSTTDNEAMDFRRHVIEWLMLHHPHDCPVCDEGGHCLLQDQTVSGGHGMRRYAGNKRTHQDQYLGPLIQHEMNRCIQCYRCVRYYQELAGSNDLGVMGIGSRVYFGRHKPGLLKSRFSGNLIDICPTGVYTDKPSRFLGRRWDFQRAPSICIHCALGCNLVALARYRRVVRHEARPNMDVNGYFLCDRGRYGYPYAHSGDRPRHAMANGTRQALPDTLWTARRLLSGVVQQFGPHSVAMVGSVRNSLETLAAMVHLSHHHAWLQPVVVNEARQATNLKTATASLDDDLAVSLGEVSVAEHVLVLGADPINEAPMLALALRQVQRLGGHVAVLDPRAIEMPFNFLHLPVSPQEMKGAIQQLIDAAGAAADTAQETPPSNTRATEAASRDAQLAALAVRYRNSRRVVIVCGTHITAAPEIGLAAALARTLRGAGGKAQLFYTLWGPNAFAAGRMTEDTRGVDGVLDQIEAGQVKALVVVENDLWRHYPNRPRLIRALDQLEQFILLDHLDSPLVEQADVFLPTQTLYEAGGHWINQEGRLQEAEPVLVGGAPLEETGNGDHPPRIFENAIPDGAPMAAWQLLLAVMDGAQDLDLEYFSEMRHVIMDQATSRMGVLQEGKRLTLAAGVAGRSYAAEPTASDVKSTLSDGLCLLLVDWTFGTEGLSCGAAALSEMTPGPVAALHPQTADRLGLEPDGRVTLTTGVGELCLDWQADARMALDVIVVPRHYFLEWQMLGATRLFLRPDQIKAAK